MQRSQSRKKKKKKKKKRKRKKKRRRRKDDGAGYSEDDDFQVEEDIVTETGAINQDELLQAISREMEALRQTVRTEEQHKLDLLLETHKREKTEQSLQFEQTVRNLYERLAVAETALRERPAVPLVSPFTHNDADKEKIANLMQAQRDLQSQLAIERAQRRAAENSLVAVEMSLALPGKIRVTAGRSSCSRSQSCS